MFREIEWKGPYSWPGFSDKNGLPEIPRVGGVYLQTFEYQDGFLIYAAGITRRTIPLRFREHTKSYLKGDYTILDVASLNEGLRNELWHGWGYARENRHEFEANRESLVECATNQLVSFRVFITDLGEEKRIHERIEAAVMLALYEQLPPISSLPDRGMQLSKRWDSEEPLIAKNVSSSKLWGLPELLAI